MDKISIGSRIKNGWNAFMNKDPTPLTRQGMSYAYRPDRKKSFSVKNDRSIVGTVVNKMAIDAAMYDIKHVNLDKNERYSDVRDSELNYCFNTESNIDQSSFDFKTDIFQSLLEEGSIAIVPVVTDTNPYTGSTDICELRVGKIKEWFPSAVRVELYNDRTGLHEEKVLPKRYCAIIQNPFYSVMNEYNSTLQRLIRKLSLLDYIDEQSSSGKLDLIVQLPYIVKSENKKEQARQRKKDIEDQLTGSKYGIAYIDATEKITQLNRSVDNQLLTQVESLQNLLFAQLGITQAILDGSADEATMLNYYQRTINPIIEATVSELKRKFLSKTARTQKQTIMAFRDPFRLVPMNNIAEMADKFTRNEIMSSNEFRQILGMKPSDDPKADELINSNLNHNENQNPTEGYNEPPESEENYND